MKKIFSLLLAFGLLLTTLSAVTAAPTTDADLFYVQQGIIKYAEDTSGTQHSTGISGTLPSDCPDFTTVIDGDTYSPELFFEGENGGLGFQYTKNGQKYDIEMDFGGHEITGRPICAPTFTRGWVQDSSRVADFFWPVEIDGHGYVMFASLGYDHVQEYWYLIGVRSTTPIHDDWYCTDPAPALNGADSVIISCKYIEGGIGLDLQAYNLYEQQYDGAYPAPRLAVANTNGNAITASYDGSIIAFSDLQPPTGNPEIFKAPFTPGQQIPSVAVRMTECTHDCWYPTIAFGEDIFAFYENSGVIRTATLSTCENGDYCNFEVAISGNAADPYYELAFDAMPI